MSNKYVVMVSFALCAILPQTAEASATIDSVEVKSMTELLEKVESGQSATPSSDQLQIATFSVEKSWKGRASQTILVTSRLHRDDTGSHPVFIPGQTYLVFAYKSGDNGVLHVPVGCASLQSAEETEGKIRVLGALTKKPGST